MLIIGRVAAFGVFIFTFFTPLFAQQGSLLVNPVDHYRKGKELYEAGQYAVAQAHLDEAAQGAGLLSGEQAADADYLATMCAIKLYNGDSEERVDKFAREHPLNPRSNRLYLKYANHRFNVKRYRDAAEYYEKVNTYRLNQQELSEYRFKKGYAYLQQEEQEKASELFYEIKDGESQYANSAKYYYAHLLYADSSYREARDNFLPLQNDPSFGPMVPYYLAHIYYELGNYEKLVEVGEDLIDKASESRAAEIAKLMADAFYNQEDYENAAKYLSLYSEKGGRMLLKDHFQLGYSHYKMGKYQRALESFNKIAAGPNALQQKAYYHLADCYLQTGQKSKAVTAFKAASELNALPEIKEDAAYNYAKLAYETADPYQNAIITLKSYLQQYPDSPHRREINEYLTNLYITSRDYDKALEAIEESGLVSPNMQAAYQKIAFFKASDHFTNRQYSAALQKLDQSLEFPQNPDYTALAHYWKGENYYQLGSYEKAIASFEKFRNVPGSANMKEFDRSFYQTGYCYFKLLDFKKAADELRTFVKNSSNGDKRIPDAYLRLGDAYLISGGYLISIDFYDKALQKNTAQPDYAYFQKSECLGLDGRKQDKISKLRELLRRFPESNYAEDARYEIAATHLQIENYQKALEGFEDFQQRYPNSPQAVAAQLKVGLIYSNTDRNEAAISTYRKVVKEHPGTEESKDAVNLAAIAYKRLNRMDDYLDWVEGLDFMNFAYSELDSTAYNSAFETYTSGDCDAATQSFESYLNRYPKGLFVTDANFYLADCAQRQGKKDKAARYYANVLEAPNGEYTVSAVRFMSQYRSEQEDYEEANRLYKRWLELASSRDAKTRAQAGVMRTAFKLKMWEEALLYAELLRNVPSADKNYKNEALRISALSLLKREQQEEAKKTFRRLVKESEGEDQAIGLYYQAKILHEEEMYDSTKLFVDSLIQSLPSYKEWKMKSLLLLARNFWKQDDIFQANYTLDFIIKSEYSEDMTAEAKALKQEIKMAEAENLRRKKELMKKQNQPIILDEDNGLQIIDERALPDTVEPIDTLK